MQTCIDFVVRDVVQTEAELNSAVNRRTIFEKQLSGNSDAPTCQSVRGMKIRIVYVRLLEPPARWRGDGFNSQQWRPRKRPHKAEKTRKPFSGQDA